MATSQEQKQKHGYSLIQEHLLCRSRFREVWGDPDVTALHFCRDVDFKRPAKGYSLIGPITTSWLLQWVQDKNIHYRCMDCMLQTYNAQAWIKLNEKAAQLEIHTYIPLPPNEEERKLTTLYSFGNQSNSSITRRESSMKALLIGNGFKFSNHSQ